MARILLVRHGESEWNAVGRWQGQADSPLTDLGRSQAKAAAGAVGLVDRVLSSDLVRARETAEIIADQLGLGPVVIDPDLRERNAGEWTGLTRTEIHARFPGALPGDPARTDGSRDIVAPPGYEPHEHLLARGLAAVQRWAAAAGGGDAVAVTHGGLVYAIERDLGAEWVRLPNLAGRWVTVTGNRVRLGRRVTLVDPDQITVTPPDQL